MYLGFCAGGKGRAPKAHWSRKVGAGGESPSRLGKGLAPPQKDLQKVLIFRMKMACSGVLWGTVFKAKIPARKGLKIIFFCIQRGRRPMPPKYATGLAKYFPSGST